MPNTRKYNWTHSSLIGSACRGIPDMQRIMRAQSASPEAQEAAARIANDMRNLAHILATRRINQDGSLTKLKGKK